MALKGSAAFIPFTLAHLTFLKTPSIRHIVTALLLLVACFSTPAQAQTLTYHLDNPSGVSGQWVLSTNSPTGTVWTLKSQSLIGAATGEYLIASLSTASGDPGRVGIIPSGSTVTFTVSMQESKNAGTIFPRAKLYLNSASGTLLCIGTGTKAITSTATLYTFSCSTTAAITLGSTDRFFLWVGINMTKAPNGGGSLTANLQFNGAQGGVTDSTVVAPVPPPPSITTLSVTSGNAGTPVTISGAHFGSTTGTVTFNGVSATVSSWTDTSIGTSVPTLASTGSVVIANVNGASNGVSFTVPPPAITSLSTSSGAAGNPVTISGSHFGTSQGSGTVTFNGTAAAISSWSDGSIGTSVPVSATTGNVVVTAANGEASTGVSFTIPAPIITNISPDFARIGTSITIAGNNFGSVQGSLKFNGTAATPISWNNTQIVAPVPSGATTGPVVVTQAGASNSITFTVDPPPSITSISPTSGPANTSVTITGSGFGIPQGTSTIQFNGKAATPFSWSDSSITVPVPAGATTGPVVVSAGGTNSNGVTFTVAPGPSITSLSVSAGAPGAAVTISGQNFGSTQGSSVVRFNGLPAAATSWAANSIGATVPSGVTTGPVTVTVSGQTSNGVTFTAITTGTLSGTVSNSVDGTAISGATVQALQNGTIKASATSAANGSYSIASLAFGSYDVQASDTGFGTALTNSIAVTAGQSVTANFILSSPGTVSGKVTQADGVTSIPGAALQLFVGSASASTTTADSNGNYSISGLNAGSYALEAGATNFVTQTQQVTVMGGNTSTSNFLLQAVGINPINYVYDELGRLVSVIDSSGDTAVYKYDAVGNILSISRQNSATLSIISFFPQSGTSGASVTINGTGFSTTPSQNTVGFNGVSASVTSATATQINVTVPATATTGPITVTAPSGSASSNTNFTVLTSSGAPTITGFTPNMGTSGTAVAVTGTNFDIAVNDKVIFNASYGAVNSATTSQINTSVPPNTASGRILLGTPAGSVTSTQDFFIPFGTHVTGDIGYTGRIAIGGTQSLSLAAGKIALLLFDGTAGQNVSVQFTSSTFSSPPCYLSIYSPNLVQIAQTSCASGAVFLGSTRLPTTGTYTIGIDPGTNTGSVTIGITADVTGPITPGTPLNVTGLAPGQDARYTFTGTAGQQASVNLTNSTYSTGTCGGVEVSILTPYGSTLGSASTCNSNNTFLDSVTLPVSGTYTVLFAPTGTGSATLLLSIFNDLTGPITPGVSISFSTSSPGQNARYTFSATAGQQASVKTSNSTYSSICGVAVSILKPDGTILGSNSQCGSSGFLGSLTLPVSGNYTVLFDPQGALTGSATILLSTFNDITGSISPGTPINFTISSPGQDARYTFNGTAGQVVSTEVAGFAGGSFTVSLLNPDGSTLASICCATNQGSIIGKMLATTGNYQIVIAPNNGATGSATVSLISQTTNSTVTFDTPVTSTISTSSLIGLSFSGTAGQIMSVEAAGLNGSFSLYLLNPDGTTLASSNCCGATMSLVGKTLATTGTYQIVIIPNNGVTGSATVSLISQTTNSTITFGTPITSTISTSSLIGLSFSGTAGQIVSLEAAGLSGSFTLYLLKPDGSTLASSNCCGATLSLLGKTLATTGSYQIVIAPNNGVTGSATVSLISQTTNGSISFGTPVTSTISSTSLIGLSFSGTTGQVVSVEMAGLGGGAFSIFLLNPDGSTLASGSVCCGTSQAAIVGKTLATTGTYQIIVVPNNGVTGSSTVSLISQTTNGSISFGTPVTSTISSTSLIGLSFSGTVGQVVSVEMAGLGGGAFSIFLLNPDGSTLASGSVCCGTSQASIVGKTLATTGTYQIIVVPNNGVTGSATISLISQTTNSTITFGSPVTSTISASSLIGLSVSGTAGQTASVQVTPSFSGGGFSVYLLNPDGSTLASTFSTSSVTFSSKTLSTTGTYQIVIAPNNGVTGSATTSLTSP